MNKKIFLFPLLFLLLITTGLGCKGLSDDQQASIKPVNIEYWTVFNDVSVLRTFAEQYKQLKPYVTINIRQVRYDEFDTLLVNSLADDVPPDIVSLHVRWLNKYAPRLSSMPGSVQVSNVSIKGEYAKEVVVTNEVNAMPTPNIVSSAFVKTVGEDVIFSNNILGLPLSVDTLAVYYNKDLLDSAGIAVPPTTWAELLEAVRATTRFDANGNIIQSGIALGTGNNITNSPDIMALLLMQNNVPVTHKGSVTFANGIEENPGAHPTREALRFYTDFARPTKEAYSWNASQGDALESFTAGRSAFYIGFAFDAERITSRAPQMSLGVLPMPQLNPGEPKNVANYWVESVVGKSANQNIAWDFVRFITTPEKIAEYTEATGRLTPLRSQITDQAKDDILGPFVTGVLTAENWYRGNDIDTTNDAMKLMIDQFLQSYADGENPLKRDIAIIKNAAITIQQTF